MCGIVAGVADKDICSFLLSGLYQLEYRGYDSAGIALLNGGIRRVRRLGRVAELEKALKEDPQTGNIGIAHTRWATHGAPQESNAHPHISKNRIALVHNGIIENYETLKHQQLCEGFEFESDTDTEVIAHQLMWHLDKDDDFLRAVKNVVNELQGAYALAIIDTEHPSQIILAREGSPLILGIGNTSNYAASDIQALTAVANEVIYLENNDIACIDQASVKIVDHQLKEVTRRPHKLPQSQRTIALGNFDHFMRKEIDEQPRVVTDALEGRIVDDAVPEAIIGAGAAELLSQVKAIEIVACGTSYHAGLVASYWFEELAGVRCNAEIASEYRYRQKVVSEETLFVTVSQSGETADTLAALEVAKRRGYLATLAICNSAESSLVRECDYMLMTHAGPEIGVASTKAFTSQLVCLLLLVILVGRRNAMSDETLEDLIAQLRNLPRRIEQTLEMEDEIKSLAQHYATKSNALFLGRGTHYPIALEGALKMKEISYIHAGGVCAGELKHGPLALVDDVMPVIAVAPNDHLLEKLKSNLQEVRARGGELHVFADAEANLKPQEGITIIKIDAQENAVSPIIFTVSLQLLAYHTALLKGADIDKPRNLAKAVTVE